MEQTKYDIFISYSRKDKAVADRICSALEKYGISFFIDRKGIGGGMEFPAVLAEAIEKSRIILFLASKNSYQSKFTNKEITFAFNEKPSGTLLPYVIDGSPLPASLRFTFSDINIRTIEEHPIETVLMHDLCQLLGYEYKTMETLKQEKQRADEEFRKKIEHEFQERMEKREKEYRQKLEEELDKVRRQIADVTGNTSIEQLETENIDDVEQTEKDERKDGNWIARTVLRIVKDDRRRMFKKPFHFSGRIRRLEYGISYIIFWVCYFSAIITSLYDEDEKSSSLQFTDIVIGILIITMLWFLFAQGCKRCHDRGRSGWFQLIPFYVFLLLFGDGEPGGNKYGTNPKE